MTVMTASKSPHVSIIIQTSFLLIRTAAALYRCIQMSGITFALRSVPRTGGTVSRKEEASLCSRNQPPGGLGSAILQIGKETLLAVVREAEQDREFIANGDISIAGLHRI